MTKNLFLVEPNFYSSLGLDYDGLYESGLLHHVHILFV